MSRVETAIEHEFNHRGQFVDEDEFFRNDSTNRG